MVLEKLKTQKLNILQTTTLLVLIVAMSLLFYLDKEIENLKYNNESKDKLIDSLIKRNDSLLLNNKEYNNYLIRKKAEDISGLKIPKKFKTQYITKVFQECEKHNIPPRLAFRLIYKESSFNKNSKSSAGASGFMQIMPGTYRGYAKKLSVTKHNEYSNIEVGIFYLRTLHNYFKTKKNLTSNDKWRLTVLSYNYGIGKVGKNRDVFLGPKFKNYSYVNFITA